MTDKGYTGDGEYLEAMKEDHSTDGERIDLTGTWTQSPKGRQWGKAYRDTTEGKPDYQGYLNPLVIEAFGKYMLKHQVQSNGEIRESDNWQGMFGEDHKRVCMSSGFRHFMDWWKFDRGYETRDGISEALGGLLFNLQAYWLAEILEEDVFKEDK